MISFAATAKLICVFVFAFADCCLSQEVANFLVLLFMRITCDAVYVPFATLMNLKSTITAVIFLFAFIHVHVFDIIIIIIIIRTNA